MSAEVLHQDWPTPLLGQQCSVNAEPLIVGNDLSNATTTRRGITGHYGGDGDL